MGSILKTILSFGLVAGFAVPMSALADTSPTILIETGPSDKAEYRRMVYVKYLRGNYVSANYKAYNRREFINMTEKGMSDRVSQCANGAATSLREIKAFARDEASRKRKGKTPETRSFCIKHIGNWSDKNKNLYLDPIFSSMPYIKGGR